MKILTIVSYYYPHWTGLTAYATNLAEGLAARGHDMTVLTTQHQPALALEDRVRGVRVVRLRPMLYISRGAIAPHFWVSAARLIEQHDVVIIHTPLMESPLVTHLARQIGRPVVMVHHGDLTMPAGMINQTIERVVTAMMTRALRQATHVVAYSRDYAEHSDFLHLALPKLTAIYPPVSIPLPDATSAMAWRDRLGLADKKLVGFAGRWVEEKGFDYLLQALPAMIAAEPRIHLIYAGEQEIRYERFYDTCRDMVRAHKDRITFVGLLHDRQQLANYYAMCDVFTLPSRTDCLALVQPEAMLCGTPVVAADIPGARVVVRETGMGRLVTPRSPAALAEGILAVLAAPASYQRDRESVRAIFNTHSTLDQYERLLDDVLVGQMSATQLMPPVVRYRLPNQRYDALTAADQAVLERVLANEFDPAYRRRAMTLLDYLDLHDGERVLDAGCGMGFYLLAMSRLRRLHLTGLDGEPMRLNQARQVGIPATLVEGDLHHLPFPDAAFDKILLSEVLEHVSDDHRVLRELYRVLAPGGTLALSVPHASFPPIWDPISWVRGRLGMKPIRSGPIVGIWANHERLYYPEDLALRAQKAGFVVEDIREATHYSIPFAHILLYGVGKPVIESPLLPAFIRRRFDRLQGEKTDSATARKGLAGVALALLTRADRRNDEPIVQLQTTFVNLLLKARKPDHAPPV